MKQTRWMIIFGIILLVVAVACFVTVVTSLVSVIGVDPENIDAGKIVGSSIGLVFAWLGAIFSTMGGLFLVIFGSIYGRRIDKREAIKAEEKPEVSFTDAKEFIEHRCTLANVKIVNTNQLNIEDKIINMSDISKIHMDRNEIRFKTNNEEYIISYQNNSEALFLVGRLKQYSK